MAPHCSLHVPRLAQLQEGPFDRQDLKSPVAAAILPLMSLGDLSDEELLAEYAKRSGSLRDAIVNELFKRHYARVARWCLRFAVDREAAADLAQDVFLKAHRHLGSFKGTSRFSTWLYTIVRHESLNRIRRRGPPMDSEDVLEDVAALETSPEELVERGDRLRPVGDDDAREREAADGAADLFFADEIQMTGGLVEQQDLRLFVERARQQHPLLLPS